jgi:hypothetical protein
MPKLSGASLVPLEEPRVGTLPEIPVGFPLVLDIYRQMLLGFFLSPVRFHQSPPPPLSFFLIGNYSHHLTKKDGGSRTIFETGFVHVRHQWRRHEQVDLSLLGKMFGSEKIGDTAIQRIKSGECRGGKGR